MLGRLVPVVLAGPSGVGKGTCKCVVVNLTLSGRNVVERVPRPLSTQL